MWTAFGLRTIKSAARRCPKPLCFFRPYATSACNSSSAASPEPLTQQPFGPAYPQPKPLNPASIIDSYDKIVTEGQEPVRAAEVVRENDATVAPAPPTCDELGNSPAPADLKTIPKKKVRFVSADENMAIEFQKFAHRMRQVGPYVASHEKDVVPSPLMQRDRREIQRVCPYEEPFQALETSFRRIPKDINLPNEYELRFLYPQTTKLPLEYNEAHCADLNALDIHEIPLPIQYGVLYPPNYDATKTYPTMVVLSDGRGLPSDHQDVCANWFERGQVQQGLHEQKWILFFPVISFKNSQLCPCEAVIATFCDWVVANYKCENNRVHLFGKGWGAYAAIRTCIYHKEIAISVTAILGRIGASPFRLEDRPREKVKNVAGTHVLVYVPGYMFKTDYAYKFKNMMDWGHIKPAARYIHFAEVRDHQIYYAINPYEFWNYMKFFRDYPSNAVQPLRRFDEDV